MTVQSPWATSRLATWARSSRGDSRGQTRLRITVPLAAEDVAVALHVSLPEARDLVRADPGYALVEERWLCPN